MRTNVGVPSLWKEYGPTPDVAIPNLDETLKKLEENKQMIAKRNNVTHDISTIEHNMRNLEMIKKQASEAVYFNNKGSDLFIPHVTGRSSNPEYLAGYFG